MIELLLTLTVAGIIILSVTLFNAITGPFLRDAPAVKDQPLVSILVPARNEESNIRRCLESLCEQDYPILEILVLDDHSEDGTLQEVHSLMGDHLRIKLLSGRELPEGWTGKNWACFQLQEAASGKILIFCDADTWHHSRAVSQTVGWMQTRKLGLLSAFPQQQTITWAEKLVIPVVDMFVFAGLPLWTTYYLKSPGLAAANGQWIAFTRQSYEQIGGHQNVSDQLVEDVELSRRAKKQGIRILLTAGTGSVFCRMYHSASEVWEGFSKNIFGICGYSTPFFLLVMSLLLSGCVMPYILLFVPEWQIYAATLIAISLVIRLIMVARFRHPFFSSILGHPLGVLMTVAIGFNSWRIVKKGAVQWKGRQFPASKRNHHDLTEIS